MCVQYSQKPEEGVTFPGAGGTAGYEPPDASSGSLTLVLLKSSAGS